MIFDDERSLRTINNAPNPYVIKIFFYIAFHQPQEVIRSFQISKSQLQFDLKLDRTIFFEYLSRLKYNLCINEIKQVEELDFMVNPYIVMNNGDRKARIAEWSRRLNIEDAKIKERRKQKRLRELKNASKQ